MRKLRKHKAERKNKNRDFQVDPEYMDIAKSFAQARKKNKIYMRDLEVATQTGGGRVSDFEGVKYNPTLHTFIKWCRMSGVRIKLLHAPKPDIRKIVDNMRDPARLLSELKEEKLK